MTIDDDDDASGSRSSYVEDMRHKANSAHTEMQGKIGTPNDDVVAVVGDGGGGLGGGAN